MVENIHKRFPDPKLTSSNCLFFFVNWSSKQPDVWFTKLYNREIFTFEKMEWEKSWLVLRVNWLTPLLENNFLWIGSYLPHIHTICSEMKTSMQWIIFQTRNMKGKSSRNLNKNSINTLLEYTHFKLLYASTPLHCYISLHCSI